MSGEGIYFMPVGGPDGESHCDSYSVPFMQAGIGGFAPGTHFLSWSGAFPEDVAFSSGLTGVLGSAGDADAEAHFDWFNSQPDDFSGTGKFLADGVVGLDTGEWSTPAAGGMKKAFRAGAFSCAVEPSVFVGTFSEDFPEDFSVTGKFLVDGVVGLDTGEWATPANGGRKKLFRSEAFSCGVEPSVFVGTFSEDFPVAARVARDLVAASESEPGDFPLEDPFAVLVFCDFASDDEALGVDRSLPFETCDVALTLWLSRPTNLIGAGAGDAEAGVGVAREAAGDVEGARDVGLSVPFTPAFASFRRVAGGTPVNGFSIDGVTGAGD